MNAFRALREIGADRFDLCAALYAFGERYHSGQWSRGYRLLSRTIIAGFQPGMAGAAGYVCESYPALMIYRHLWRNYKGKV